MIKAVFFDIGKTLIDDPFPKAKYIVGKFLQQQGALKEAEVIAFHEALTKANNEIDSYQFSHFWGEGAIVAAALSKFGMSGDDLVEQVLEIYRGEVRRIYETNTSLKALPNSELNSLLTRLHGEMGLTLGVISDERVSSIPLYWQVLDCGNFFSIVVTSEEVGCRKPCERVFQYALARAKVEPNSCLYVGDNPLRDIAGAKNVGMKTVLFTKFLLPSIDNLTVQADFVIDELHHLEPLIRKIVHQDKSV